MKGSVSLFTLHFLLFPFHRTTLPRVSDPFTAYAITAPGIEAITAAELTALGLPVVATEPGGVTFSATPTQLYAANLHSRTATRVVVRVAEFTARTFFELERHARKVPWERFAAPGTAVEFRVTSRKSKLYHQRAIEERLLRWTEERGFVPQREESSRSQLFLVRLHRDRVMVSADSSGELLHRRGYRLATAKAPVRETLAAAMLLASGWDALAPLIDPLCGAGTIPIEAALIARRVAPGIGRTFAFERWPEFASAEWVRVREAAIGAQRTGPGGVVIGADRDAGAVTAARANAERAGVAGDIEFTQESLDASTRAAPRPGGWLITNPPYGIRVGQDRELSPLYATLGAAARHRVPGGVLGLLSADPRLDARIGIPLTERFATENGGLGVRFVAGVVSSG